MAIFTKVVQGAEEAIMNPIKLIIKDLMKSAGFRCKRNSWYRQCNDLIQILTIQKSCWGNQYYINLGMDYYDGSFLFPSEYMFPPEYKFGFRIRADELFGNIDFKSLDLSDEYDEEKRTDTIREIISNSIAFFDKCNSTSVLRKDYMDICHYHLSVGALRDVILG